MYPSFLTRWEEAMWECRKHKAVSFYLWGRKWRLSNIKKLEQQNRAWIQSRLMSAYLVLWAQLLASSGPVVSSHSLLLWMAQEEGKSLHLEVDFNWIANISLYVCMYFYVCFCECPWRQEGCRSQVSFRGHLPWFVNQAFSLAWTLSSRLGWWALSSHSWQWDHMPTTHSASHSQMSRS